MRVSIVGPSWIAVVLLALLALESSTLMPRFDGEVVSRPADSSQNHLDDVDLEANHRLARIAELDHLDGAAADLGVAEPVARVVLRGILGCGVQGESWIAPEVLGLHRSGHHPHPDFPVGEFHLNPTCPRGAIPSDCGQNLVAASIEDAPHSISELGLGRSHLGPRTHASRVNPAASTASSFDLMSPYAESSTATKRSTILGRPQPGDDRGDVLSQACRDGGGRHQRLDGRRSQRAYDADSVCELQMVAHLDSQHV